MMFLTFKLFDKLYYFYLNRYANCAAQFISAYTHKLTGADLAWVNKNTMAIGCFLLTGSVF